MDDEPSCRLFEFDLESIPLERAILKEHIVKEIQGYHTKRRPKPILTPVNTLFRHPIDGGGGGGADELLPVIIYVVLKVSTYLIVPDILFFKLLIIEILF